MDDMINRQDAIKAIRKCKFESDMPTDWYQGMETAQDIVDKVPSAEAVEGWIPVSERLPSDDGKYLVFYEGTIIGSCIETMRYGEPLMPNVDVSGKHFYSSDAEWGDIIYDEVIAWMPLPTPYKGGDNE